MITCAREIHSRDCGIHSTGIINSQMWNNNNNKSHKKGCMWCKPNFHPKRSSIVIKKEKPCFQTRVPDQCERPRLTVLHSQRL